jgi:UDP-glucose 4-epimerase
MTVLVTGGAGYIGSHTVVDLLQQGHKVVIVDNLANSNIKVLDRIQALCGKRPDFEQVDLCDFSALKTVFSKYSISKVIHFAGLKAVGESSQIPLCYYQNNLIGTMNLLELMQSSNVFKLVFSSSATVYGDKNSPPYQEDMPLGATNPYGQTKMIIEQILDDVYRADNRWNIAKLRYFNPVGAHPSGTMGEDPLGIPNNLMPFITQVAVGRRDQLNIFGNDYPTPDGTCIRDYIHVSDLARGHIQALVALDEKSLGSRAFNLGAGKGLSVLEVKSAFERASGRTIDYQFAPRRSGDLPEFYADANRALEELNWKTTLTIDDMCRDSWNWQSNNEGGYE